MGILQNHGQVHQDMLNCHSSFIERHNETREALHINFHLIALSMIPIALFAGKSKKLTRFWK
jgi:hypothetical protein